MGPRTGVRRGVPESAASPAETTAPARREVQSAVTPNSNLHNKKYLSHVFSPSHYIRVRKARDPSPAAAEDARHALLKYVVPYVILGAKLGFQQSLC